MALTFDELAAAVTAATNLGAAGSLPVKVKNTEGSVIEIANIVFVNGDVTLTPTQSSEADCLQIRL